MKNLRIEQPRSLADIVADRLRKAIIDGDFGLGEAIREEMLAETFGVSRTPVRDALIQLEQQGLVRIQSKRGSSVFSPSVADVARICDYRKMIELNALAMALERDRKGLIARLEKVIADMDEARDRGDAVAYGHLDTAFHQAFVDFSGNPYVIDAYQLVSGPIAALRTHLTRPIEQLREQSLREHKLFLEHARAGDLDSVRTLMDHHVDRTAEIYISVLTETEKSSA